MKVVRLITHGVLMAGFVAELGSLAIAETHTLVLTPKTVEELVARIDAVSVESTRNAAHALLTRSRPAVVALGSGRGLDTAVSFAEGLTRSKAKTLLH